MWANADIARETRAPMDRRHGYKGFVIEAAPHELKDGSGWTTDFFIEEHEASGVNVTQFVLTPKFDTREEAILAAFNAGKGKIDVHFANVGTGEEARPRSLQSAI